VTSAEPARPNQGGGAPKTQALQRDILKSLGRAAVFSGVDEPTLAALAASATRRAWDGGTVLFQRGDAGDFLLALTSGRVRLSVSSPSGKELVLRHMGPGEVLGEFSLIDGQPRSADATVVEPSAGILLHRDKFLQVAASFPQLGMALARHLCQQLRSTNYQMESIALYDLKSRVARFLLFALREQHGAEVPDRAILRMVLNQSELASVLGASRPKINQVLQSMLTDAVLVRDGATLICDVPKLEAAAEVPDAGAFL
jgi:CRP-like cAMP-binding protein